MMFAACFAGCGGQKAGSVSESSAANEPKTDESKTGNTTETVAETKKEFENKELEIGCFEGGYGKAYWEECIKSFEADYPGVKVTLISSPKIMEIITPRIVSGNPPDFLYMECTQLAKDGSLIDLTDVFEGKALDEDIPLKDKIMEGFLEYCKPTEDGKIYYAPTYMGAMGLYYNKTYFEEKGLKPPKTWDEFFDLGDVAKSDGKALYTYQGIYPSYNEMILYPMILSNGGMETLNKILNYEEGAWRTQPVREVLEVFMKIAEGDYLLKGTVAMNHTQAQTEFLKGNALFLPCGNWIEGEMKDAIPEEGFSFGFIPAPVLKEGDQHYALVTFEKLSIPVKARNIELAKEFLRYQYTDKMVVLNAQKTTGVVPVKNAVEKLKEYIPESSYNTFKALDDAKPLILKWRPTPPLTVNMNDEIFNPLSSIMSKKMTLDEWIDKIEAATAKIREEIANAEK